MFEAARVRASALCLAMGMAALSSAPSPATAQSERWAAELMDAVMWNREPIGGPFELVDQNGARRTDADFRGRFMLVYFGFTYCPDICPADLLQMARAVERLGPAGDRVQPVFVTLDPERDTPEHLKDDLSLFRPGFVGLGGSPAAVRDAARACRVYYEKVPRDDGTGYTIDHSAFIYLMAPDGRYLGFFPPGTPAERMAESIGAQLAAKPP